VNKTTIKGKNVKKNVVALQHQYFCPFYYYFLKSVCLLIVQYSPLENKLY